MPEKTLAFYLSKAFPIEEGKHFLFLGNKEIDIYIPALNLGIEYDGKQWAESIKYRVKTEPALKGFDLEDTERVFELAQTLLEDPYQRMFDHLSIMKRPVED